MFHKYLAEFDDEMSVLESTHFKPKSIEPLSWIFYTDFTVLHVRDFIMFQNIARLNELSVVLVNLLSILVLFPTVIDNCLSIKPRTSFNNDNNTHRFFKLQLDPQI